MTLTDAARLSVYSRPETGRLRPLTALRAFRRLVADKEDTTQVFRIMQALAGQSLFKGFERMLRDPDGSREVYRGLELVDRLRDKAWLAGFAPGTVGHAYAEFMQTNGFEADGLVDAAEATGLSFVEHPRAWYSRRLRDVHDIWHVLTGYETDALGEVCVVAFSYGQTGQLGYAAIGLGGALDIQRSARVPALKAAQQAWRAGRAAAWLPALDYETLFAEPLESARTRLNLRPGSVYHAIPRERRRAIKAKPMGA